MKDFSCKPPVPPTCGEPCPPQYPPLCPPPKPMQPCPPQTVPSVVQGESYYEMLFDMNNRINTMCNVYNDVMNNSYQTLHELQRAAEENGAYYGPCEIWTEEGYYAEESAAYQITHKAVVDRRGEPIRMELGLAYGNTTNSQVSQGLFDASKVNFADKITPAQPIVAGRGWYGNAIWHGAPIQSASEPTLYTMGFTRSGVMRVYSNGVTVDQMLRDTIENAMGVPGVLIQNGQVTDPTFQENIPMHGQQVSRVCIGQNLETREILFLTTGAENNVNKKGLTSAACAQILLQYGCDIAVELVEDASAEMLDKGSLMFVPKDNELPDAYCFWYISRKKFYKTDYEREMAELMQNYAQAIWHNLLNKAEIAVTQADLQKEIDARIEAVANEANIRSAQDTILQNNIDQEAKDREEAVANEANIRYNEDVKLQANIDAEETARKEADATEQAARIAADTALGERIDKEITDREAAVANEAELRTQADALLQSNIDAEATARTDADNALGARIDKEITDRQDAVAAEAAAREAADAVLQTNIDTETSDRKAAISAEETARIQADTVLQNNIDAETAARTKADSDLDAAFQLKLDQINTKINALESDIINLQTLTGLLQRQLAAALESITAIQTTITAIEEAVSNITKSLEDIRNGVTNLPYLPISGGRLTGNLSIAPTATSNILEFNVPDTGEVTIAARGQSGTSTNFGIIAGQQIKLQPGSANNTVVINGTGQGSRIENVATPVASSDAATKGYVDAAIPAGIQPATETTLGGIMVGDNLSITPEGKLSANAGGYTLPAATADTLGGIKVGANLTATADGTLSAPVPGMSEASADAKYLAQAGGTVTGTLTANQGVTVPSGQGVKSGNAGVVITGTDTKISGATVSLSSGADNAIPVKLSNLALPAVATDAATKAYVDSAVAEGSQYELPTATAARLGGVKVGQNLTVTDDGTLNAVQGTYTLPAATTTTLGGVKVGTDLAVTADGTLSAVNQRYTLPVATTSTIGGVKPGTNLTVTADGTLNAVASGLATESPNGVNTLNWQSNGELRMLNANESRTIDFVTGNYSGITVGNNAGGLAPLALRGSEIYVGNLTPVKIRNVANPTEPEEAANKVYVDSQAGGGLKTVNPKADNITFDWDSTNIQIQLKNTRTNAYLAAYIPQSGTQPTITTSAPVIEFSPSVILRGVNTPIGGSDVANKTYVDSRAASAASDVVASHTHPELATASTVAALSDKVDDINDRTPSRNNTLGYVSDVFSMPSKLEPTVRKTNPTVMYQDTPTTTNGTRVDSIATRNGWMMAIQFLHSRSITADKAGGKLWVELPNEFEIDNRDLPTLTGHCKSTSGTSLTALNLTATYVSSTKFYFQIPGNTSNFMFLIAGTIFVNKKPDIDTDPLIEEYFFTFTA